MKTRKRRGKQRVTSIKHCFTIGPCTVIKSLAPYYIFTAHNGHMARRGAGLGKTEKTEPDFRLAGRSQTLQRL